MDVKRCEFINALLLLPAFNDWTVKNDILDSLDAQFIHLFSRAFHSVDPRCENLVTTRKQTARNSPVLISVPNKSHWTQASTCDCFFVFVFCFWIFFSFAFVKVFIILLFWGCHYIFPAVFFFFPFSFSLKFIAFSVFFLLI